MESKGSRSVGLTILPPLCAECLEILSGTLRAFTGIALPLPLPYTLDILLLNRQSSLFGSAFFRVPQFAMFFSSVTVYSGTFCLSNKTLELYLHSPTTPSQQCIVQH